MAHGALQHNFRFGQFAADQASFSKSAASRSIPAIKGLVAGALEDQYLSNGTIRAGGSLSREIMRSETTRTEKYLMGRRQPIDFLHLRKSTTTACRPSNNLQSVILQRIGTITIK
ncbi:hypothetical protein ACFL1S_02445 [Pseudomonadota bacterium]